MTDNRLKEEDIVQLIKGKEAMFGEIGQSALIFEKAIMQGKTIMDCMICTEGRGVIGIEIKTERDSTQRLNKQIENYSYVCDYVYVMCHDKHVEKVEAILKRKQYLHVGIIAYVQVGTEPWVGIYKEATISPMKDVYHTLNILWRRELSDLLGTFKHPAIRVEQAFPEEKSLSFNNRSGGVGHITSTPLVGRNSRKPNLIHAVISRLGPKEANKVFCDIMIQGRNHLEKAITIEHFNPKEES